MSVRRLVFHFLMTDALTSFFQSKVRTSVDTKFSKLSFAISFFCGTRPLALTSQNSDRDSNAESAPGASFGGSAALRNLERADRCGRLERPRTRTMDPSKITPEMMAFAQKQMANMTPEQMVRGPRSRGANDRAGFALPRPSSRGMQGPRRRARAGHTHSSWLMLSPHDALSRRCSLLTRFLAFSTPAPPRPLAASLGSRTSLVMKNRAGPDAEDGGFDGRRRHAPRRGRADEEHDRR